MNLRFLVSPALYGGSAAAAVAALGYALAGSQSLPLTMPAFGFAFGGATVFALFAGTSSLNENAETPETVGDSALSAPTEAGGPRRLLVLCFSLALALAGVAGIALFA
ncbi:hypothetical protein [Halobacterium sp. CBA1126]|uniref:hypothetical protein n=1 Tax=Halobacterium TaxID=2239 RepID=UPI0012FA970B|nr:hypothetical protein [Halobacterium sp. CBA1126]MUV60507.1 hypothetical protein [Halobacterium sp. CBA1126]